MKVLVINSGSSSIKFQYMDVSSEEESVLLKGVLDRIGLKDCEVCIRGKREPCKIQNHEEGIQFILSRIPKKDVGVVGHRVVHGGEKYREAVVISDEVIVDIEKFSCLAPLHNPPNLAGIKACRKLLPDVPQVAVFDTAFHSTMPKEAFLYGLPYSYYERKHIRRYGFHGTSHHYIMLETIKLLGRENINMISCHLGNGSSICAIKNNESVDTSMGFTPMAGVLMGTRSGDVDPGIITFLEEKNSMTFEQVEHLLNKESGLLGIGGSSDMRDIWAASKDSNNVNSRKSQLAMDMLAYSVVKYIGSYAAVLGTVDALVFTGGLGENAFYIRKKVLSYLEPMGVRVDDARNERNELVITKPDSAMKVLVIPTNEELMIAKESVHAVEMSKYMKKRNAVA
jgi:acetate kinase